MKAYPNKQKLIYAVVLLTLSLHHSQAQTVACEFDQTTNSVNCGGVTNPADNTVVLGHNATSNLKDSVSVGSQSSATQLHTTKQGGAYSHNGRNESSIAGVDNAIGVVSVGNTSETRQIQHVSAGVLTQESTDAVNASQLHNTNQAVLSNTSQISSNTSGISYNNTKIKKNTKKITNVINNIDKGLSFSGDNGQTINYQLGDTVHIQGESNITTSVTSESLLVTLNPHVSLKSISTENTVLNDDGLTFKDSNTNLSSTGLNNGGNVISNVAAGVIDTDAVNVSQLNALKRKLSNDIENVEDTANSGTASALAASHIPQPYVAGASMFGIGAGSYGGQNAISIGLSTISDNGKLILKGSATFDTQQKAGVGLGVGFQW